MTALTSFSINPPSRPALLRVELAVTGALAALAVSDALALARRLGIAPQTSKTWLVLLGGLVLLAIASLVLLAISFFGRQQNTAFLPDLSEKTPGALRWLGWVFAAAIFIYPVMILHPYYGDLLAKQPWLRLFIFWLATLLAAFGIRLAFRGSTQPVAVLSAILLQTMLTRLAFYLPDISAYPFAMGWSETSRFYYPALFLSRSIFGQQFAWPILHPSLHLLLVPPYLVGAPLWFHRFWQVALRLVLLALVGPALLSRLQISERSTRWLAALWVFVYLLTLPLYLHLAVPVILMLWAFPASDDGKEGRAWFVLVIASIWAGLSRLNWYPVPGMLAAALYFLENRENGKSWRYFIKPAAWFLAGTLLAFTSMQIYIQLSGLAKPSEFYTSLSSTLLWYRLLPNESYWLGVLPGIIIFTLPLWLAAGRVSEVTRLRAAALLAMLAVLFAGGLVVSTKIGGGADIHNMDAYAVLLVVVFGYVFAGQVAPEKTAAVSQKAWGWALVALLVVMPAWFASQGSAQLWQYDPAQSGATLQALQQRVDDVNAHGGEILFITQRHLISMDMLQNVKLVPEYEREELMEMAMAQNNDYLQRFRNDIEKHRFAAIIVDPLRINFLGDQDAMGAENNAWTRSVAKRILCNYKQDAIFPADRIAIYVPQTGVQRCP